MSSKMTGRVPDKGKIYAYRKDRFGGRMIAIINALRLAHRLDADLRVCWPAVDDIGKTFNDPSEFFDPGFITRHLIAQPEWDTDGVQPLRLLDHPDLTTQDIAKMLARGRNLLVDTCYFILPLADETRSAVMAEAIALWRAFPLAPDLRSALTTMAGRLGPDVTAYHVRRGDVLAPDKLWTDKFVPDEYFLQHLASTVSAGGQVMLFSDDAGTVARYKAAFPGIFDPETILPDGEWTVGQRDALAFGQISLCGRVRAPPNSAFSFGAALLGGVDFREVTADLSMRDSDHAGDALLTRLSMVDRAEDVATKGEITQAVPYLLRHLRKKGRLAEAPAVLERLVASGLERTLIPILGLETLLEIGELGSFPASLPIELAMLDDAARAAMLIASGLALRGDATACAHLAATAIWTAPFHHATGVLVSAMSSIGMLDARSFLPFEGLDPRLSVPANTVLDAPCLAAIRSHFPPGPFRLPSHLPLVLDWSPLLRVAAGRVANSATARSFRSNVERLAVLDPQPAIQSLAALVSPPEAAMVRLQQLAHAHPHNLLARHRLSLMASQTGDHAQALELADSLVTAQPDRPAALAWRGLLRLETGDERGAMGDLIAATTAGLAFPGLYLAAATAARRLGQAGPESRALDQAVLQAPFDIRIRLARSAFFIRSGEKDAARAELEIATQINPNHPQLAELRSRPIFRKTRPARP
jgi:tetratricopeptide (TPR) repeat protein